MDEPEHADASDGLARAEVRGHRGDDRAAVRALHAAGAFSGVNDTVTDGVNRLAGLGLGRLLPRAGREPVDPRADPVHAAAAVGRARRRQPAERDGPRLRVGSRRGDRCGGVVQGRRRGGGRNATPPTGRTSAGSPATSTTARATSFAIFLIGLRRCPTARSWCRWRSCTTACAGSRSRCSSASSSTTCCSHSSSTPSPRGRRTTCRRRRAPSSRSLVAVLFMVLVGYHAEKARAGGGRVRRPRPGRPIRGRAEPAVLARREVALGARPERRAV